LKAIIAAFIKSERKKAKLTQEQLSAKIGISTRYYQMVETGKQTPGVYTIFKMCRALGLHYTVVFDLIWNHWLKKNK